MKRQIALAAFILAAATSTLASEEACYEVDSIRHGQQFVEVWLTDENSDVTTQHVCDYSSWNCAQNAETAEQALTEGLRVCYPKGKAFEIFPLRLAQPSQYLN